MDPVKKGASIRRINRLFYELPFAINYLEIGLRRGETFQNVRFPVRIGVDPYPLFDLGKLPKNVSVFSLTSDEFFAESENLNFDFVYLDGLHTFEQSYRDLIHSLRLCPFGLILVDDVVPSDKFSAMRDELEANSARKKLGLRVSGWHGDVFKLILCLRDHHPQLSVRTIIGSGNPQALVWRNQPVKEVEAIGVVEMNKYSEIKFDDIFYDGIPNYFFPCSEEHAIRDAIEGIRNLAIIS